MVLPPAEAVVQEALVVGRDSRNEHAGQRRASTGFPIFRIGMPLILIGAYPAEGWDKVN